MKNKTWWRRMARWLFIGTLGFLAGSALLVLILRFVHPPFSALMAERRIASWFSPEPYTSRHTWVSLEEMSPSVGVAVIAAEDQNFAEHFGFDWQAIEKAYAHNEHSKRKRGAYPADRSPHANLAERLLVTDMVEPERVGKRERRRIDQSKPGHP